MANKDWLGRLSTARQIFDEWLTDSDKYVSMYKGEGVVKLSQSFNPKLPGPTDVVYKAAPQSLNYIWAYVQDALPHLLYQSPAVMLKARNPHEQRKAEVLEQVLRAEMSRVDFVGEGRKLIIDALLRGYGVTKLGLEVPPFRGETPEEFFVQESPKVTFARLDPHDFLWEPGPWEEARWAAHVYEIPVEKARKNPLWTSRDLKGTRKRDDGEEMIGIYEVWIKDFGKDHKRRLVFVEGREKPIYAADWEIWPFDVLVFHQDPEGKVPGLPDVAPWAGMQTYASLYFKKLLSHAAMATIKLLVDARIPEEKVKAFLRGGDMTALQIELDVGESIQSKYAIMDIMPSSPEHWKGLNMIQSLLSQISGWSPQQPQTGVETATEASIIKQSLTARMDDRRAQGVFRWADSVLRKMLEMVQKYYTAGEISWLTPEGKTEFVEFTEEDLDVDALFQVEFGQTARDSEEVRAQKWTQLLQMITPFLAKSGGIPQPLREFLRRFMVEVFHIPDADRLLPPVAPLSNPALENTEMALGDPVIATPQDEHELHIQVHNQLLAKLDPEEDDDLLKIVQEHLAQHQRYLASMAQNLKNPSLTEIVKGARGGRPPGPQENLGGLMNPGGANGQV